MDVNVCDRWRKGILSSLQEPGGKTKQEGKLGSRGAEPRPCPSLLPTLCWGGPLCWQAPHDAGRQLKAGGIPLGLMASNVGR